MIHVIATIRLVTGKRSEFLKQFHELVPLVHAEAGCLDYGPTIDIASGMQAQGPVRDDVVTVVERWQDLAALKAHSVAPHMQAWREKSKHLVQGVELLILEPA